MNNIELKEILENHSKWLKTRYSDDVKGKRANLRDVNLYEADLEESEEA